jgi:phage-related tail protein
MRTFISRWFGRDETAKPLAALNKRIARLAAEVAESNQQLLAQESRLGQLSERFRMEYEKVLRDMQESRKLNTALTESLAAVRAQLETAETLTIPTLVASHQLLIKRAQADMAVQGARIVGVSPLRQDE